MALYEHLLSKRCLQVMLPCRFFGHLQDLQLAVDPVRSSFLYRPASDLASLSFNYTNVLSQAVTGSLQEAEITTAKVCLQSPCQLLHVHYSLLQLCACHCTCDFQQSCSCWSGSVDLHLSTCSAASTYHKDTNLFKQQHILHSCLAVDIHKQLCVYSRLQSLHC